MPKEELKNANDEYEGYALIHEAVEYKAEEDLLDNVYNDNTNNKCDINNLTIPIHMEVEYKTGSGYLSKDQVWWKGLCEKNGVPYFECRNKFLLKDEIDKYINNILDGLRQGGY